VAITRPQLDAEVELVRAAAASVRRLGGRVSTKSRSDAILIMSSLIRHCARYAPGGDLRHVCRLRGDTIRLEVRDEGDCGARQRLGAATPREGGLGLMLVDRLASDWGIEPDGAWCLVWAELPARRRG
jgi:anti-sigma regulatory factor (Ser/Thr protein kinase)